MIHTSLQCWQGVEADLPCQPQLEGISSPAALDGLVTQVVLLVQLVWLEEVAGIGGIALLQQACIHRHGQMTYPHLAATPYNAHYSWFYSDGAKQLTNCTWSDTATDSCGRPSATARQRLTLTDQSYEAALHL